MIRLFKKWRIQSEVAPYTKASVPKPKRRKLNTALNEIKEDNEESDTKRKSH